MADNYYNGNKVWNHILGGNSYMKAYANGKVVIDGVQKIMVMAYISNVSSSGRIEVALERTPASDLTVSIFVDYDLHLTNKETGVTTQESRTNSTSLIFRKGSGSIMYYNLSISIPSGYIFNGVSLNSVRLTRVTPTSDEVYNYSY